MPRDRSRSRSPSHSRSYSHRGRDERSISPHRKHSDRTRTRARDRDRDRSRDHHHRHNRSHRHHHRSRSRSSSSRSRSPPRRHHRSSTHRSRHNHHNPRPSSPPPVLPSNARQITKHDFPSYEALFAEYLDIQKGLFIKDLSEREVKGRFKRFVTHWNRGELAKGWYDPARKASSSITTTNSNKTATADNAITTASESFLDRLGQNLGNRRRPSDRDHSREIDDDDDENEKDRRRSLSPSSNEDTDEEDNEDDIDDDDDDEMVGPLPPGSESIPTSSSKRKGKSSGVTMPTIEDLDLQKEQLHTDRQNSLESLRASRKSHKQFHKEQLEELAPRAAPGTRDRKLEKKKELNEKMRSFREKSPDMEVPEADMMGGGGSESFKQLKAAKERKKNERELRKEALLRQRMEEREGRLRMHREKEERTIAMLKALAESSQRGGGR